MNENNLTLAQQDITARLASDEWFVDIPVMNDRKADIISGVNHALGALTVKGGKMGICALVLQPVATVANPNLPSAVMNMDIAIRVMENVLINSSADGTGKDALSVCRRIVDVLHLYCSQGLIKMLLPDSPTIVPVRDEMAPVAYEVRFKTSEDFRYQMRKVAPVALTTSQTASPWTVTAACSTTGADIYFTVDGSYPSPSNGTKYTAAVAVQSACSVRAGAVKTAMIASDIAVLKLG